LSKVIDLLLLKNNNNIACKFYHANNFNRTVLFGNFKNYNFLNSRKVETLQPNIEYNFLDDAALYNKNPNNSEMLHFEIVDGNKTFENFLNLKKFILKITFFI
jgi:hypothetical protein